MLILFDVDATLITTSRAGVHAMGEAGRELYGPTFDENTIEYSGRLDPLIIADLLTTHDLPSEAQHIESFRAAYKRHLIARLEQKATAQPCPGVLGLLEELSRDGRATMGLLTGNYPETGEVKLRAAGIEMDQFALRVWGDDSPHSPPARDHLPGVALERYESIHGAPIDPSLVVIVGDTPHDVGCAKAHGCRSLAVATGMFTSAQLQVTGADGVVDDLAATRAIMNWIFGVETGALSGRQASEA